jgi:molecular chaperone DnaK
LSLVVGIDLGTTNSLVAHLDGERPQIIPNRAGARMTPSVVGLDKQDRLHVGTTAKAQLLSQPDRTAAEVKRLMGSPERVTLGPRTYSPTEISGLILRSLAEDAERFLGRKVEEAVITVPAYFTDAQRQGTKDAGELAGLKVERILNEPTAAALAYGLDHLDKEQFVLVYDLGGGTFDVSVLEMFEGVLDVKASSGNNHLGGSDFDRAIVELLLGEFEREHGVDLRGDRRALSRLKAAAEQAKIELSAMESTPILVPYLAQKEGETLSLETELTRARLEALVRKLVESTFEPVTSALRDAGVDKKAVADVVLVGGATRVPLVRRLVAEYFEKAPREGVHPDEAVALGAAIQAGLKTGAISAERGIMITDVCPFTLGVEIQTTAGAQRLAGVFSPIIPRNSTVPVSRTEVYSTTSDGQGAVDIKVYQGESQLVRNNVYLDQYSVDGVPPAPAGVEKVAVTFTYDINGILKVSTKIVSTGKEAHLLVDKTPQRMSPKEREAARARLEKEWRPAGKGAAAGGPSGVATSAAPAASMAAAAPPSPEVEKLLAAARARLPKLDAERRPRLLSLIEQLEAACTRRDAAAVARLDVAITDLLFELG